MRRLRSLTLGLLLVACTADPVAPSDAGVACTWTAPPHAEFCNVVGAPSCNEWAASLGTLGTALARCAHSDSDAAFGGTALRCASADRCDGDRCYCGSEAECESGRACMLVGDQPRCIGCDP